MYFVVPDILENLPKSNRFSLVGEGGSKSELNNSTVKKFFPRGWGWSLVRFLTKVSPLCFVICPGLAGWDPFTVAVCLIAPVFIALLGCYPYYD